MANKYEEIRPFGSEEIIKSCNGIVTLDDTLAMEWCILNALNFELNTATPLVFLDRYIHVFESFLNKTLDPRISFLSQYIIEKSFLEYFFLKFTYSHIALASLVLSLYSLKYPYWIKCIEPASGYTFEDLMECLEPLYYIWRHKATSDILSKKYRRFSFGNVFEIKPRGIPRLNPIDSTFM